MNEPDDAAVWELDDERVLVVTTDFFTPIVDNPFDYGQIAAANSLSDIYAMGAKPFLALNVAGFPPQLPAEVAGEILRGGAVKALEAGTVIAGGHTIQDQEPKYGLIALGFGLKDQILKKGGMTPGDTLFISKPVGSGIITSAIKSDRILEKDVQDVIGWMKKLNDRAADVAIACGACAATDITGFSLLGHAWEMAAASGAGMRIFFDDVPFFPNSKALAEEWCFPGGSFDNLFYYGQNVSFAEQMGQEIQLMLFDPQTSGGLLFAVPKEKTKNCYQEAEKRGISVWKIGEVTDSGRIEVV